MFVKLLAGARGWVEVTEAYVIMRKTSTRAAVPLARQAVLVLDHPRSRRDQPRSKATAAAVAHLRLPFVNITISKKSTRYIKERNILVSCGTIYVQSIFTRLGQMHKC